MIGGSSMVPRSPSLYKGKALHRATCSCQGLSEMSEKGGAVRVSVVCFVLPRRGIGRGRSGRELSGAAPMWQKRWIRGSLWQVSVSCREVAGVL